MAGTHTPRSLPVRQPRLPPPTPPTRCVPYRPSACSEHYPVAHEANLGYSLTIFDNVSPLLFPHLDKSICLLLLALLTACVFAAAMIDVTLNPELERYRNGKNGLNPFKGRCYWVEYIFWGEEGMPIGDDSSDDEDEGGRSSPDHQRELDALHKWSEGLNWRDRRVFDSDSEDEGRGDSPEHVSFEEMRGRSMRKRVGIRGRGARRIDHNSDVSDLDLGP